MSKDVVLILSGGLDSSTLLYKLLNEGNKVTALSFNYGQKAAIEIERAAEICKMNDVPHFVFDIQNIVDLLSSSLTDSDNDNVEEPKSTVVPSRNTILLELATAFAISNNKEEVYYGAIKADKVNNYEYIPVCAPFIDTDKKDVVKLALKLGVPIEKTWSCYVNNDGTPCGECFSCKSRIKAIEEAKKELGMD